MDLELATAEMRERSRTTASSPQLCATLTRRYTSLPGGTSCHSAPSAMGCLGSRVDPVYARYLPRRITAAIVGAVERLQPARVGWAQADDPEHTFNRPEPSVTRLPNRLLTRLIGPLLRGLKGGDCHIFVLRRS